ncbi:hypothetical protein PISL3812_03812 [Talaromyces islandicus]|uniref:F-box domain-containing protein n=1 Tax=Talaromyces islandicus TaxID=28573 RepID=A0A0U1LW51_TALIS|nr:hypothetical protein PISL3812_03812 [Talaromyces islandicus]
MAELSTLYAFEALESFEIEKPNNTVSYIASWLCQCKNLRSLNLGRSLENASLLSRILVDERICLESLNVGISKSTPIHVRVAFYRSLAFQSSLHTLCISSDDRQSNTTSVIQILLQAVTKLNQLRELDLNEDISLDQLSTLTLYLPKLAVLTVNGTNFDDDIWPLFFGLKKPQITQDLRELPFYALGHS